MFTIESPMPPFGVVQMIDEDGDRICYRLIPLDEAARRYVLYPLAQHEHNRKHYLIPPACSAVSTAMRATMTFVPDTFSSHRMMAERLWEAEKRQARIDQRSPALDRRPQPLPEVVRARWEVARRCLAGIVGSCEERNARLRGTGLARMFLDTGFRGNILMHESARVGVSHAELKRLFFRWIRYGGDAYALLPVVARSARTICAPALKDALL